MKNSLLQGSVLWWKYSLDCQDFLSLCLILMVFSFKMAGEDRLPKDLMQCSLPPGHSVSRRVGIFEAVCTEAKSTGIWDSFPVPLMIFPWPLCFFQTDNTLPWIILIILYLALYIFPECMPRIPASCSLSVAMPGSGLDGGSYRRHRRREAITPRDKWTSHIF